MAGFLDGYEPVQDRIMRFWADHPDDGRIITELISYSDTEYIVRAEVWIGDRQVATGYAHETVTDRGVNATSALENCDTSAQGRALASAGYSPKSGVRPSREEMSKPAHHNGPTSGPAGRAAARNSVEPATDKQLGMLKGLCRKAGTEFDVWIISDKPQKILGHPPGDPLNKGEASALIEAITVYLNEQKGTPDGELADGTGT